MITKKNISVAVAGATLALCAVASPAFAETSQTQTASMGSIQGKMQARGVMQRQNDGIRPVVLGTVTSISGSTIVVTSKPMMGADKTASKTATEFTIDASKAVIKKNNATSSLSAIVVGDMVAAEGSINGTRVTATVIHDGIGRGGNMGKKDFASSTTPMMQGNGQPVVAGTISAINGSSITVTTKSNVTYTVDISNAKVLQGANTVPTSTLVSGDQVVIQGAVNGTSVTAANIMMQKARANQPKSNQGHGFFGGIGSFFSRMFGF